MRYPDRESAHQQLLAAALITIPEELAPLIAGASTVAYPIGSTSIFTWSNPGVWSGADVSLEHVPAKQAKPKPKCRFDLLVRGDGVTAVVECKWGAGTSSRQLTRYAKVLRDAPLTYPKPILILVTADGAAPPDAQLLAAECKLPLVFLSWDNVHPVIVGALGPEAAALSVRINEWRDASRAFTDQVRGNEAIAKRTITGDEDADDDDCPDEGASVTRGAGNGVDASPKVIERIALLALALECCSKLRTCTGLDWHMRSMPHEGPRGDVQCHIAPRDGEFGILTREGMHGEPQDKWSHIVGQYQHKGTGEHDARNSEKFYAVRGYGMHDDGVRLRASFRLYFAVDGTFHFQFGTAVVPYLIDALPKKKRHELNANVREIGSFDPKMGTWKPGPSLQRFHDEFRKLVAKPCAGWTKSGRDTSSPSMWNTYIEVKNIAKAGDASRVDRIVNAVEGFLQRVK
jgi:hypothetical protein